MQLIDRTSRTNKLLKNLSVSFDQKNVLLGDYLLAVLDRINYITVMFRFCAYLTSNHYFTYPKVDKLIPKWLARRLMGRVLSDLV